MLAGGFVVVVVAIPVLLWKNKCLQKNVYRLFDITIRTQIYIYKVYSRFSQKLVVNQLSKQIDLKYAWLNFHFFGVHHEWFMFTR